MEKGFYEAHKMKEYHAFKIVPHTLFDVAVHIPEERQSALGKGILEDIRNTGIAVWSFFMSQRQVVLSGVMERPAY